MLQAPLLLSNLVSLGQVAVTYQPAIEQLLVLLPQSVALMEGTEMANLNTKQAYKGLYLDFNLNVNLPPVCNTGFLPAREWRAPSQVDYPGRPAGSLYCRVPQDAKFGVRGSRNYPCQTVPGKRAPTVQMCESDEQYVPLNDGYNWKGAPKPRWRARTFLSFRQAHFASHSPRRRGPALRPNAAGGAAADRRVRI